MALRAARPGDSDRYPDVLRELTQKESDCASRILPRTPSTGRTKRGPAPGGDAAEPATREEKVDPHGRSGPTASRVQACAPWGGRAASARLAREGPAAGPVRMRGVPEAAAKGTEVAVLETTGRGPSAETAVPEIERAANARPARCTTAGHARRRIAGRGPLATPSLAGGTAGISTISSGSSRGRSASIHMRRSGSRPNRTGSRCGRWTSSHRSGRGSAA